MERTGRGCEARTPGGGRGRATPCSSRPPPAWWRAAPAGPCGAPRRRAPSPGSAPASAAFTRAVDEGFGYLELLDRTTYLNHYWAMSLLAALLIVLPSWREGFPRAAMEAAASGLPVIASDVRGCRQVVDHDVTGLLVPVRDGEALAAFSRDFADCLAEIARVLSPHGHVALIVADSVLASQAVYADELVTELLADEAEPVEVLADAALAEAGVFLAEAGVVGGEGAVVEVAQGLEAGDDGGHFGFAGFAGLDAGAHKAAELGDGAHAAGECSYGVLVEGVFGEGFAVAGFAGEGHGSLL